MKTVKVKFVGKWAGMKPEDNLVCYWLMKNGYDVPYADKETLARLSSFGGVQAMPCVPSEGSVKVIGETVVIGFQELDS